MTSAALLGALLTFGLCGVASSQTSQDGAQTLVCVSSAETRALYFQNRLFPPIRVMREAAEMEGAEAIDIQLCRFQSLLVYDVTLLNPGGRVLHRLIDAVTGKALGGHAAP